MPKCPKCKDDLVILIDAYVVYSAYRDPDTGEILSNQELRTDEFDDRKIWCETCQEEFHESDVV